MSRYHGIGIGPNLDPGLEVERIEGDLWYLRGHKTPFKSPPTLEDVRAADIMKDLLKLKIGGITGAFEYILQKDWAYRLRFLDLCNETTPERLQKEPIREIRRLLAINRERDYKTANGELVSDKLQKFGRLIQIALLWPPFRRKFREYTKNLPKPDEIDKYWMRLRTDYKSGV